VSRQLRIFVSSTMRDLANERQAVCHRLASFNFEPVNAEGWLPTGTRTWPRISQEIESCNVFVLILGDGYGWTPTQGPQSELGLSVTHLEYRAARERGLPILPFLKRLSYQTERHSDDAKKRDAFREEVSEWAQGQYVAEFELATDLADAVGHALVQLLTDQFLGEQIRERAPAAEQAVRQLQAAAAPRAVRQVSIPQELVAAVSNREAVLFAGAGISLAAGLPSAAVFTEHLSKLLLDEDPHYAVSPVGSAFAAIASDVEAATSREVLVQKVATILNLPRGLQPTVAHQHAIALFDIIFTTNWDDLFEQAAGIARLELPVIARDIEQLPSRALVKLHGSLSDRGSLLLTETDVAAMDKTRAALWAATRDILRERPLVVVGSSLRDPSIVRLFAEAKPRARGYFIAPQVFAATERRLKTWNLECISAEADTFLASLARAVSTNRSA
jgi:hypothetical protein